MFKMDGFGACVAGVEALDSQNPANKNWAKPSNWKNN